MAAGLVADERRELDDHLGDRSGADAEQERDDAAVEGRGADPGAEDRGAAGQQAEAGEPESDGRFCATGATTASPSVVLWIANPITSSAPERERAGRVGGADREAFAEVVEADADRHEQREVEAARPPCPRPPRRASA